MNWPKVMHTRAVDLHQKDGGCAAIDCYVATRVLEKHQFLGSGASLFLSTSTFRGRDLKDSTRGFIGIVCEADNRQRRRQLFEKRARLETERP